MTWVLRFWPHLLTVAAFTAAVWYFSSIRYDAGYRAAETVWRGQLQAATESGRKAVDNVREQVRQDAVRDRRKQLEAEQRAREDHHKALTAAQEEARIWRARYHEALSTDDNCATWSRQTVACPL